MELLTIRKKIMTKTTLSNQLLDNIFKAKRQQLDLTQNKYTKITDEDYLKLRNNKLSKQHTLWLDDQLRCLNAKKIVNRSYKTYFVTTTFYGNGQLSIAKKTSYIWDHYLKFYKHLIGQLLNHPKRKKHLHPITLDYIDFPKSKSGNALEAIAMPHIHSIYLIDEAIAEKFENMYIQGLDRVLKHTKLDKLATCYVQKINEYEGTSGPHQLFNTVKYCSKYAHPKMNSYAYQNENITLCQFLPLLETDFQNGLYKMQNKVVGGSVVASGACS
jgi:hypothetical protein